jgi:hypothetical protein
MKSLIIYIKLWDLVQELLEILNHSGMMLPKMAITQPKRI